MAVPFRRAAATARAVSCEAAALAGHLLLYPTGIPPEEWPDTWWLCRPHRPTLAPLTAPDGPLVRALDARAAAQADHCRGCDGSAEACTAPGPVLLLHGFIDNRSVFTVLRRSLRRQGWQHVHGLNYSLLTMDVRSAAVLLGRHVEHARHLHGGERVALVGHSLGGLIGRYYVQRLGGDEHVHTLVTLGAPHSGTLAARLPSPLPITRQLRPDSDLIQELCTPAVGCRTRFVAFWSDLDQLILPARFARLDHPDLEVKNILVPGIGHLALTVHTDVVTGIQRVLQQHWPDRRRPPDPRADTGAEDIAPGPGCPPDQLTA